MGKVEITRSSMGICAMQVCAEDAATDEEILAVCNEKNPAGTNHGWATVVRTIDKERICAGPEHQPCACADFSGRTHFIVLC